MKRPAYIRELRKLSRSISTQFDRCVRVDIEGRQDIKFNVRPDSTQEATALVILSNRVSCHENTYLG